MAGPWLSKSRFLAGTQCARQLWWRVHEPEAPELVPDGELARRLEVGREVGERARGFVPGGVTIEPEHGAYAVRVEATRRAIEAGARVLYEATFFEDGVFVAVDVLERVEGGWCLVEVKSTTRVEPHHVLDAAVQTHILRRAGLAIVRVELMHLSRACVAPKLDELFVRDDITARVEALQSAIPAELTRLFAAIAGPLPQVAMGPHCDRPYVCPFAARCGGVRDGALVRSLHRIGSLGEALAREGVLRIADLPADRTLPAIAERQRRALVEQRTIVEPTLGAALAAWSLPIAFLDFETIAPAIPRWPGTRPYETAPVQFSLELVRAADAPPEHAEHLAEPLLDARPALCDALLAATAPAATVVAYNAPFERRVIASLARAVPARANALEALAARVVDLLPVVRDHVAHPGFEGRFGLKHVARAFGLDEHEGLAVRDGATATHRLEAVVLDPDSIEDVASTRSALLAYCAADTRATYRLWLALRALSSSSPSAP
jgi:hypothetical protein